MAYLTLAGDSCFTASEAQKLKDLINKVAPIKVANLRGSWVYHAHIEGDANDARQKLAQLLPLSAESGLSTPQLSHIGYGRKWFVTPRYMSPWNSKATSIAQVCGFEQQIRQIERGRVITIEFACG